MTAIIDSATKLFGVAGSITTLLALAALSILGAYLLAAQWLHGKDTAAKAAIDQGDDRALARLLGGVAVPLDALTPDQKYALAAEELRSRARQRTILHALLFFGFLALLGFALALALAPPRAAPADKAVRLDLLQALNVLSYVQSDQREKLCPTLMAREDCVKAATMIASLTFREPTADQGKAIEEVAARGSITQAEAKELAACGGVFEFKVVNDMLTCSDGTPMPVIAIADGRRPIAAETAIVLHASATSKATPFAAVAQMLANGRPDLPGPLAHLLISKNGAIAQTAPFSAVAMHVGRSTPWHGVQIGNSNAIGIEMIHSGDYSSEAYPETQMKATAEVVRVLMRAYGIRTVVGHAEVAAGRKVDPGPGVASSIRQAVGLPAN